MTPRDHADYNPQYGSHFKPEVQDTIKLTLAFAKAVGNTQKDKTDNLVVSPYNALAALAMVAKGAEGQTREELARALFNTDAAGLDDAIAKYTALNTEILAANAGQVTVATANAVWTNEKLIKLRQAYADDLKATMGADISEEDFNDPATIKKINEWAANNTNGLIDNIVEKLNPDDAAVLASALYFKGLWTSKFDKKLTKDKAFTGDDALAALTPMMHQGFKDGLRYSKGDDFEAIALTFGEDNEEQGKTPTMRFILARPTDENVSARDWLAAQSTNEVPAWLDNWSYENAAGTVEMPHMDIKQKHDIIPALQELGVRDAFKDSADFSNMAEKDGDQFKVGKATQDIALKVDEEGGEGAAVTTVVVVRETCIFPPKRVDVKFDRSFVLAVQDVKTGAVMFVGAVNKPNEDMKPTQNKDDLCIIPKPPLPAGEGWGWCGTKVPKEQKGTIYPRDKNCWKPRGAKPKAGN
jgi:serine protease inhibitor